MGIRFSCHMCNHPLHVKDFQAGKRGKCPKCQGSFRVPANDSDFSLAVEESADMPITAKSVASKSRSSGPSNDANRTASNTQSSTQQTANQAALSKPATSKPVATRQVADTPSGEIKPMATPTLSDALAMPASLLPLLEARWFVRPPSGGQYGPATTQMLLDWIGEKRVTADSLLWREGLDTWFSARELIPEPFGGLANVPTPNANNVAPPAQTYSAGTAAVASTRPSETVASTKGAVLNPAAAATSAISQTTVASPSQAASNKSAIAMKKKRQIKQQWMVLGLLATMALCLVIALVVILTRGA